MVKLKENERIDDLERNGYRIIQNPGTFCFGIDAVLLSGFAKVNSNDRALDLGTGTGILPILLEAKTNGSDFTGLEIQPESVDMARRSVELNNLSDRIKIVQGDIKDAVNIFAQNTFDVITCNPPYMINDHGIRNPNDAKAVARHEILCTLEDVITQAAKLLKVKGHFYMVHRPFRLAEIIALMTLKGLEPKRLRMVHPYLDREPNLILIEGVKSAKSRIHVEKPLIIYEADGVYSKEMQEEYGF